MGPKIVHLGPECLIGLGNFVLLFQLENQRHQRFGNETTAKITKPPFFIGAVHEAVKKIVCHLISLSLLYDLEYDATHSFSSQKFTLSVFGDAVPRP